MEFGHAATTRASQAGYTEDTHQYGVVTDVYVIGGQWAAGDYVRIRGGKFNRRVVSYFLAYVFLIILQKIWRPLPTEGEIFSLARVEVSDLTVYGRQRLCS